MFSNGSLFTISLIQELLKDYANDYGAENWDSERYGQHSLTIREYLLKIINFIVGRMGLIILPRDNSAKINLLKKILGRHLNGLFDTYNLLEDDYSKDLLVKIIAYRTLGYRKVKLMSHNPDYHPGKKLVQSIADRNNFIKIEFNDWTLVHFDLEKLGYPIRIYNTPNVVHSIFLLRQYSYSKKQPAIEANSGDYVIDAGGCWGDSALYFAHKVGSNGKVYTFEFIPHNIEIMSKNFELNPGLSSVIEIISHPLWSDSDTALLFSDNGPASKARINGEKSGQAYVEYKPTTIDEFVEMNKVPRVDYIKMDIEGAELPALKGANKTIRKHRPRLAISIYHSLSDFVDIPKYLSSLDLGYKFYLDHFTIHSEETILFADSP